MTSRQIIDNVIVCLDMSKKALEDITEQTMADKEKTAEQKEADHAETEASYQAVLAARKNLLKTLQEHKII